MRQDIRCVSACSAMGGLFVLPVLRLAPSAALSGQQCPAGCDQRGHERLEQMLERGSAAGLTGHEGAVDGGQRETRELVGDRALRIVAERGRDLRPQQLECAMQQLRRMWSSRPEDAAHRSDVLRAMRAQSMEFSELNVEYGHCYQSAAVVPDGNAAPAPADEIRVYQPSTCPGAPLPHAWIDDEDGQAWCEAASQLAAEADVPLDALRIGHVDGTYTTRAAPVYASARSPATARSSSARTGFIAWRSPAGDSDPRAVLTAALSRILARPVSTPAASAA